MEVLQEIVVPKLSSPEGASHSTRAHIQGTVYLEQKWEVKSVSFWCLPVSSNS